MIIIDRYLAAKRIQRSLEFWVSIMKMVKIVSQLAKTLNNSKAQRKWLFKVHFIAIRLAKNGLSKLNRLGGC